MDYSKVLWALEYVTDELEKYFEIERRLMMSDEKKHVEKDVAPKTPSRENTKLEAEIEKLKAESAEWHNKYMRVLADMDNARKQNAKDQQYYIKYRAVPFIENSYQRLISSIMSFAKNKKIQCLITT